MLLAGMLELADREFQAIQNADKQLSITAANMVRKGDLVGVEITPNALKIFLDNRLGSDGRMRDWSYEWTAKLLKQLGFSDLKQVEAAIARYDDRELSRIAEGGSVGQISRFEMMLLASLGSRYVERHPWKKEAWFAAKCKRHLERFAQHKILTSTLSLD